MLNYKSLSIHKAKINITPKTEKIYKFLQGEVSHVFENLDKECNEIALINIHTNLESNLHLFVNKLFPESKIQIINYYQYFLDINKLSVQKKFDLILFPMGLHWVWEVPKFLLVLRCIMKDDGILFCNFIIISESANPHSYAVGLRLGQSASRLTRLRAGLSVGAALAGSADWEKTIFRICIRSKLTI